MPELRMDIRQPSLASVAQQPSRASMSNELPRLACGRALNKSVLILPERSHHEYRAQISDSENRARALALRPGVPRSDRTGPHFMRDAACRKRLRSYSGLLRLSVLQLAAATRLWH